MNQAIATTGLTILPIEVRYAAALTALPFHHRDVVFDAYGVTRRW